MLDNDRRILLRDGLPVLFVPLEATIPFYRDGTSYEQWLPDVKPSSRDIRPLLVTHEDAYFAHKTEGMSMGCAYRDTPGKGHGAYVLRYHIRDPVTYQRLAWCFVQTEKKSVYRVHDFEDRPPH
jgi:hypothetical protein